MYGNREMQKKLHLSTFTKVQDRSRKSEFLRFMIYARKCHLKVWSLLAFVGSCLVIINK